MRAFSIALWTFARSAWLHCWKANTPARFDVAMYSRMSSVRSSKKFGCLVHVEEAGMDRVASTRRPDNLTDDVAAERLEVLSQFVGAGVDDDHFSFVYPSLEIELVLLGSEHRSHI